MNHTEALQTIRETAQTLERAERTGKDGQEVVSLSAAAVDEMATSLKKAQRALEAKLDEQTALLAVR